MPLSTKEKQDVFKLFCSNETEAYRSLCCVLNDADFLGSGQLEPEATALMSRYANFLQQTATSMRLLRDQLNKYITSQS